MQNRDIKFRVWDSENKTMLFGGDRPKDYDGWFLYADGTFQPYDYSDFGKDGFHEHLGDLDGAVEVMQYTGLTDRNGVEIYEGDIIQCDEKEWGHLFKELVEWDYSLLDMRENDYCNWWDVIGNIYENPELLEE